MGRVIFKTIVSGPYELPFVMMNLIELKEICDLFLITEADVTHVGEQKGFDFESSFIEHIQPRFSNVQYIKMNILPEIELWNDSEENDFKLRRNEFLTRSRFVNYISPLSSRDIVISVDGDEVIHNSIYLRMLIRLLKFNFRKEPLAFLLTLNHFMYFVNLHFVNYDFYSPSISHAGFYLNQKEPHWRGGGKRIWTPLGTHFSWVMTPEDMTKKILRYSHRDRLKHLARVETMQEARESRTIPMEPDIDFTSKVVERCTDPLLPKSLAEVQEYIFDEVVINPSKFWS